MSYLTHPLPFPLLCIFKVTAQIILGFSTQRPNVPSIWNIFISLLSFTKTQLLQIPTQIQPDFHFLFLSFWGWGEEKVSLRKTNNGPPTFASQVLGLKECATTPGSMLLLHKPHPPQNYPILHPLPAEAQQHVSLCVGQDCVSFNPQPSIIHARNAHVE